MVQKRTPRTARNNKPNESPHPLGRLAFTAGLQFANFSFLSDTKRFSELQHLPCEVCLNLCFENSLKIPNANSTDISTISTTSTTCATDAPLAAPSRVAAWLWPRPRAQQLSTNSGASDGTWKKSKELEDVEIYIYILFFDLWFFRSLKKNKYSKLRKYPHENFFTS